MGVRSAHRREAHAAPRRHRETVKAGLFVDHDLAEPRIPVGVEVRATQQIPRGALDPLGTNARHLMRIQTTGFHELGGHHPARLAPGLAGLGREVKNGVVEPVVGAIGIAHADIAQQPREQRPVDTRVARLVAARAQPHVPHDLLELTMHLLPLAQPGKAQEALSAESFRGARAKAAGLLVDVVPETQEPHEIRAIVLIALMRQRRRGFRIRRPLARIGDAQGACDDQHLGETVELLGGEYHAADRRVHRKARQSATDGRQRVGGVDGAELAQKPVAVVDAAPVGRIQKGEGFQIMDAECPHG